MHSHVQFYEVLLRRAICPPPQLASLQSKYYTSLAGHTGEKRVLFELKELTFPHTIIDNFHSINFAQQKVQIDILYICKHFILILEVKNISGRIDFDDRRRQLIRTKPNGEQESFMNPVDQVKRHQQFIEQALMDRTDFIPVESAVVIANPNTLIGRVSNEVPIFDVSGLRSFISDLHKKYRHVQLNTRQVTQFLKELCVAERPIPPIKDFDIRPGVLCVTCNGVMLLRKSGYTCANCGTKDENHRALKRTLSDYKILYGNTLTNKAFRDFFLIRNRFTAHKYLKLLNLPYKGDKKGRIYFIDY